MSFLPIDQQKEADQAAQQTTNFPAGEAPPTSGGSAGEESGGPKTSATGTPTQFGSSASKLGDYLSANAPQIQNQATNVTGKLNTQYGQLQQGITDTANQFGQQVQQGYAAPNKEVVNQAISNPTQFTADPNNIKAFQAQYNNAYTGPQNFESTQPYGQIQGQVNNAVQQANLLGTQSGLQSYLTGQQKNPTQASTTLDSLLLRGNPQAQQQIQQAANQFKGLTEQFGQATQGANQSVQAAQKAAEDARNYAQGQVNPYVQNFGNTLNTQAQTAQSALDQYNKGITTNRGTLNSLQALLSGYQGASGKTTPDLLSQYFAQQPIENNITTATTATPEQYAQSQALAQLLGQNYTPVLNPTQANLAGTANSVPANYTPFDSKEAAYNMAKSIKGLQQGAERPNPQSPWNQLLAGLQQYDPYNIRAFEPAPGMYNFYTNEDLKATGQ